ncbi:MAG: hypothetical protein ACR2QO_17000 [Acidimicrobiales bacterium]
MSGVSLAHIHPRSTSPTVQHRWRMPALLLTAALAVGACGSADTAATSTVGSDDGSTVTSSNEQPASTPTSTATSTAAGSETSVASTSSTSTDADPSTTLPGEPFEGFARAGDRLMVVGVAHDDTLNVREGPGLSYSVIVALPPTESDVVATGEARLLDRSLWYGLDTTTGDGWVNARYIAFEGDVVDSTSQVVDSIGEIPVAETMLDLGLLVAEDRSSTDVESDIVVVVAPTLGDLGEVTYDVIGLADDSLYGLRLHVFGEPIPGDEGFSLKSVEETALCGRGVSESGLCT